MMQRRQNDTWKLEQGEEAEEESVKGNEEESVKGKEEEEKDEETVSGWDEDRQAEKVDGWALCLKVLSGWMGELEMLHLRLSQDKEKVAWEIWMSK